MEDFRVPWFSALGFWGLGRWASTLAFGVQGSALKSAPYTAPEVEKPDLGSGLKGT